MPRRSLLLWLALAAGPLWAQSTFSLATFDRDADGCGCSLGTEFPGAKGSGERDATVGHAAPGAFRLVGDFGGGGVYVATGRRLEQPLETAAFSFWVRTTDVRSLVVRLTDSSGQDHQHVEPLTPDGAWHEVRVTRFDGGPGYQSWAGAQDRRWHDPATGFTLILEKGGVTGRGTVWIDDVAIVGRVALPLLATAPLPSGNLFTVGEPVSVRVTSRGDTLGWRLEDFEGDPAAAGTTPLAGEPVTVSATLPPGYYRLRLEARRGEASLATRLVPLAVLPPADAAAVQHPEFGVCTHFAQGWNTDVLPLLVRAGIGTFRDEQYWDSVETQPGQYAFERRLEAYMAEARRLGLEPLTILSFENKRYDQGNTPHTPAAWAAFAGYAAAVQAHYGPQIHALEVWNEYNGSFCKGPATADRAAAYTGLLQAAYARLKAARAETTVLGGAAVLLPLPWFEGLFQHGALDSLDALVIHPYRGEPEGVEDEVAALQALVRKYNHGQTKPIWATETGLQDQAAAPDEAGAGALEAGRAHVARYLPRQLTLLRAAGVERAYWYLLRDYNEFTSMGLLRSDQDPRGRYAVAPAYVAYATLIRQLHGARFQRREPSPAAVRLYRFERAGQPVWVAWATQPTTVALSAAGPLRVTEMMGREQALTPVEGQVTLTLTGSAVYLHGPLVALAETPSLRLAPHQTADLGAPASLAGQWSGPPASLELAGLRTNLPAGPARIGLPALDTSSVGERSVGYRLWVADRLVGMGRVAVAVADPLHLAAPPVLAQGQLRLSLHNASVERDLVISNVQWWVAGKTGTLLQAVSLPRGQTTTVTLAVPPPPPWQPVAAALSLALAGRPAWTWQGEVADNPCVPVGSATVPRLELSAAGGTVAAPRLAGVVQLTWDAAALHLNARLAGQEPTGGLTLALAPLTDGPWCRQPQLRAWHEFRASTAGLVRQQGEGPLAGAAATVQAEGGARQYTVTLPWAALAPVTPAMGGFCLALAAEGPDGARLTWGRGIDDGKGPDGFRLVTLVPSGTLHLLPAPAVVSGTEQPLAASVADYAEEQGKGGWSYGYCAGTGHGQGDGQAPAGVYTDDDWLPMHRTTTAWGTEWQSPLRYQALSRDHAHPGLAGGRPSWSVRRWISPTAGWLHLTGRWQHDAQGDGVGGRILVDGVQVFETLLGGPGRPSAAPFDLLVPVSVGSRIDFAVTPGPAANLDYDATGFAAQIALVSPTPR